MTDFKINGFTLAEALITLGIIGIVAAMVIPVLVNKIRDKRTITRLRDTQSIMIQAVRLSEEEYGELESLGAENNEAGAIAIANFLKPSLKIAVDCGTDDSQGICVYNKKYKLLNGSEGQNYASNKAYYKMLLLNGASVWFRGKYSAETDTVCAFWIDVNGPLQPNQIGVDTFSFSFSNNSFIPTGRPGTTYDKSCDKTKSGHGCTYQVLSNNNMNYLRK